MVRKIAIVLLLLVLVYLGWVIYLNLPGHGTATTGPVAGSGPAKTIAAPTSARQVAAPVGPPQAIVPGRPLPSGLVVPVVGVAPQQLQDTFGDDRGDGTRSHGALDIMAPRGTPVIAAAGGTVEKIFESRLGGHTVYVRRTGGGWVDYYAHLDSYAAGLAEGQPVRRGQVIATVGSTGDASPEAPHLHYEIKAMAPGEGWWQGQAVNPYPLLGGR